jgi:hypothetical protein
MSGDSSSILQGSLLASVLTGPTAFVLGTINPDFTTACHAAVNAYIASIIGTSDMTKMGKVVRKAVNAVLEQELVLPATAVLPAIPAATTSIGAFASSHRVMQALHRALAKRADDSAEQYGRMRDLAAVLIATVFYKVKIQSSGTAFKALRSFWAALVIDLLATEPGLQAEVLVLDRVRRRFAVQMPHGAHPTHYGCRRRELVGHPRPAQSVLSGLTFTHPGSVQGVWRYSKLTLQPRHNMPAHTVRYGRR